jgi:hypothetical protein
MTSVSVNCKRGKQDTTPYSYLLSRELNFAILVGENRKTEKEH